MQFAVLSSGSKANCTVIKGEEGSFLIDCGLSAKETLRRLEMVGVDGGSLLGIFVTHEHRDHTVGIRVLAKKLNIPVYANAGTAAAMEMQDLIDETTPVKIIKNGCAFNLAGFSIQSFAIPHDACEPVGYEVHCNNEKLVYVTDLGKVTTLVQDVCQGCHALILEFNHDEQMLWNCDYPWELKQRISSNHGHLSNIRAAELVRDVYHSGLQHLIMGHVSEHSNTPATVLKTLSAVVDVANFKTCLCANPYQPTQLVQVTNDEPVIEQINVASLL